MQCRYEKRHLTSMQSEHGDDQPTPPGLEPPLPQALWSVGPEQPHNNAHSSQMFGTWVPLNPSKTDKIQFSRNRESWETKTQLRDHVSASLEVAPQQAEVTVTLKAEAMGKPVYKGENGAGFGGGWEGGTCLRHKTGKVNQNSIIKIIEIIL